MKTFKFLQGISSNPYIRLRWIDIEIDGYEFCVQTHHESHVIGAKLRDLYRFYMRMWNDDMNRDRLLELLKDRFADAVNVLTPEDIRR